MSGQDPIDELFPDFDPSQTQELDLAMRTLHSMRQRSRPSEEERQWQLAAFENLQTRVEQHQARIMSLRDELQRRATSAGLEAFKTALQEHVDKRLDRIRNTVISLLGPAIMLLGLLITLELRR